MNLKLVLIFFVIGLLPIFSHDSFAENQWGDPAPFERDFGDVKFLDAYFGTLDNKIEVEAGDSNVPFTVVFANVGTQDITGIKGQLSLPFDFSASDGPNSKIYADSDSSSSAGDHFHLTFFVNIDESAKIQQYPGTIKVDYSRIRESGVRTESQNFDFKVTGDSVINTKALQPFLTSLKSNTAIIEISNNGTAPISNVDISATKTTETTSTSTTNLENVILLESNWDIGNINPKSSKQFTATIYVPNTLKGDTLRIPLSVSYYNAHGDQHTISKTVDFYIKGLIDLRIFNVSIIELSGTQMVIGEIINEGNEDGLFGFVTLESAENSNIKSNTQFIDEIDTDAPVPFNIPIEFNGEPKYGEHDITIIVRYKDSVRDEIFLTHDTTIFVDKLSNDNDNSPNFSMIIIPIILVLGVGIYMMRRRKKTAIEASD
jgi:hypothetical protein